MENPNLLNRWSIKRREFLKVSSAMIAGLSINPLFAFSRERNSSVRVKFGIVTDSHYADTDPRGKRYFRESITKFGECVDLMNHLKPDFLIELGDFKDQDIPPVRENTLINLKKIENIFQQFKGPKYHVLGNHDVDSISKEDFLKIAVNSEVGANTLYYSFDVKGMHFIILDANFKADGTAYSYGNFDWRDTTIPSIEINWLKADVGSTSKPIIVFVHQQLGCQGDYCINNAGEILKILQDSDKVLAVFQGHKHSGHYSQIEGIHYYTLKAMVDGSGGLNNSYALVEVFGDGSLSITGYRRAISKELI